MTLTRLENTPLGQPSRQRGADPGDAPAKIASAVNESAKHSAVKGKLSDEELASVAAHLQGMAAASAN